MKTSFSYWSFEESLQRALTMGGCINKHGGLKTSCAWPARFMSRVYGKRRQLLSFNTSSLRRSENVAQRDSHSSLVVHLRLKYALPPSSCKLTSCLMKQAGRVVFLRSWMQLTGPRCCLIYALGDSFIATFLSVSPSVPTRRNNHLSGNRRRRPRNTWLSTCAHRLVYVIGTLQWINHLDPHLHFGYSLNCRISSQIWLC